MDKNSIRCLIFWYHFFVVKNYLFIYLFFYITFSVVQLAIQSQHIPECFIPLIPFANTNYFFKIMIYEIMSYDICFVFLIHLQFYLELQNICKISQSCYHIRYRSCQKSFSHKSFFFFLSFSRNVNNTHTKNTACHGTQNSEITKSSVLKTITKL